MGTSNYSDEFKRDAVHQITVRGYPVGEVSRRLGVSKYSLYKWVKLFGTPSPKPGVDHEAENRCRVALKCGIRKSRGVDRTWGSCGAFSVCDGQPTIENCSPCDGYSVSPFGRPPHPSALSQADIGSRREMPSS